MITIKQLFDKFNIKTNDVLPMSLLTLEIDEDLKNFTKGYKRKDIITFTGEYEHEDEDYHRVFNLRLTVKIPQKIKYDLIEKLEQYGETNDESIWENEEELDYCIKLLDDAYVEYYVSSKNIPTSYESYNIMGGVIRIS